jgi:hypothetical protein
MLGALNYQVKRVGTMFACAQVMNELRTIEEEILATLSDQTTTEKSSRESAHAAAFRCCICI